MYTSKHYTCEEIDQRLLQGYYDDAVANGYTGTLKEFWAMVLSITNLVEKEPGYGLSQNDFTNELKAKLDSIDEGAKLIERVSQLQNDAGYQTAQDVEDAINNLIAGAPEALDTLKELAEALADNPNFATDITNKLTELSSKLTQEIADRKDSDVKLNEKVDNNEAKSIAADQALEDKLNSAKTELNQKIEGVSANVTANATEINKLTQKHTEDIAAAKEYARTLVDTEKDRATAAEKANADGLSELQSLHTTDKAELASAIATETSERKAKETILENGLATEVQSRKDGDAANKALIEQEVADRKAADQALETKLQTQVDANHTDLYGKLNKEITDRQVEASELRTAIITETSDRKTADQIIQHSIEDLQDKVDANHTSETESIAQEKAAREAADAALEDKKVDKIPGMGLSHNDYTDAEKNKLAGIQEGANKVTKVSELDNDSGFATEADVNDAIEKLIGAAPEALDTLKELAAALGDDPDFAGTITRKITALTEQLNAEKASREAADTLIDTKLNQEITNRQKGDELVKSLVETEITNRTSADQVLQSQITDFKTTQTATNLQLSQAIENLRTQSDNSINELRTLVTTNTGNIQKNLELIQAQIALWAEFKTSITNDLATEISDRKAADAALDKKIDQAVSDLEEKIGAAAGTTQELVAAEKTERQAADQVLQSQIDTLTNDLTTEQNARTAADQAINDALAKEVADREAAVKVVSDGLTKEISDREAADTEIQTNLNTEIADRKKAVQDEAIARANADTQFQNNLDAVSAGLNEEKTERQAADTTLQANIDSEANARTTKDEDLQNQIDAEKIAREAADTALSSRTAALENALADRPIITSEEVTTIFNEVYS